MIAWLVFVALLLPLEGLLLAQCKPHTSCTSTCGRVYKYSGPFAGTPFPKTDTANGYYIGLNKNKFNGDPAPVIGDIICHDSDYASWYCEYEKNGACGAKVTNSVGDPKTVHNGTETQFFLKDNEPKAVLKQGTLTLFYHVANPLDAAHHTGADWITSVGVAVEGAPSKYVNVSIIADPVSLLQPDLALKPAPLLGAPLSTMIVSVGGEPLVAGVHTVEPMKIKATFNPGYKRIGLGYSERVDIITATFHIRVTSAAAKKVCGQSDAGQSTPSRCRILCFRQDCRARRASRAVGPGAYLRRHQEAAHAAVKPRVQHKSAACKISFVFLQTRASHWPF